MENLTEVKACVEAILFTMGDAVERDRLAQALELTKDEIEEVMESLIADYETGNRGMMIRKLEDKYQMCTRAEYYESLIKLCHVPQKHVLTDVCLETLSIIAYKQPVTKMEIEAIRGVKCDFAVNKLMEYHLVCELGRLDAPGRPLLLGTTDDFLRSFGVTSIEELPSIRPEMVEEFKQEAEEEANIGV